MKQNNYIEYDLKKIKQIEKKKESENWRFRAFLKQQDENKIDNIVHRLNKEISEKIDCTKCGNCCKELKPLVTDSEIERLSSHLKISKKIFVNKYIEKDEYGELYFKNSPCSFLVGTICSVYPNRPEDCKSFPHLHKQDFTSRLFGVLENYSICPIVFNVFEKLKIGLIIR